MKKIAVLGPRGTFSDSACTEYTKESGEDLERIYFPTIDEAFHAVGKGCDMGIIPIENTLDGYVQRTIDLLSEEKVYIKKEITIPVQFSLLANCGKKEDIKRVFVQFKANGQCRRFLDTLTGVEIITTSSNMESFYSLGEGKGCDGAVVPAHIAKEAKNPLVIENITDAESNYTRFVVVEAGEELCVEKNKPFKAPIYISPETDRPGMLFEILEGFNKNNINLVSIISRPTKKEMGTYNFFMEINCGYDKKDDVLSIIEALRKNYGVKIMGMYSV